MSAGYWAFHSTGRAVRQSQRDGKIAYWYLGSFILGVHMRSGDEVWVKHINRDKLDCRRMNLRCLDRRGGNQTWAEVNRLRAYGIDRNEYRELLEEQEGACAICGYVPDANSERRNDRLLVIDHCHQRGAVRALLCWFCNVGLGNFRDDPQRLRAAADYIEFHSGGFDRAVEARLDAYSDLLEDSE